METSGFGPKRWQPCLAHFFLGTQIEMFFFELYSLLMLLA